MIGMDKIGMEPVFAQWNSVEQRVRLPWLKGIPAHMRNLEGGIAWLDRVSHLPGSSRNLR